MGLFDKGTIEYKEFNEIVDSLCINNRFGREYRGFVRENGAPLFKLNIGDITQPDWRTIDRTSKSLPEITSLYENFPREGIVTNNGIFLRNRDLYSKLKTFYKTFNAILEPKNGKIDFSKEINIQYLIGTNKCVNMEIDGENFSFYPFSEKQDFWIAKNFWLGKIGQAKNETEMKTFK